MSVMFQNLPAFAPFFDEKVAVSGKRGTRTIRVTVMACVIDAGFVDIDPDAVAGTSEHEFSIRIMRRDWLDVDPPRLGDTVKLESGAVLRATSCDIDGDWFEIHAKSKGGV